MVDKQIKKFNVEIKQGYVTAGIFVIMAAAAVPYNIMVVSLGLSWALIFFMSTMLIQSDKKIYRIRGLVNGKQ